MSRLLPLMAAVVSLAASMSWIQAAMVRRRVTARMASQKIDPDLWRLARHAQRRDAETATTFLLIVLTLVVVSIVDIGLVPSLLVSLVAIPAIFTLLNRNSETEAARLAADRADVEKRARDVLTQGQLAPLQWAARLAPTDLPEFEGLEIGQAYQAGSGAMAGDFYDVFQAGENRTAAVIGDVTGHGIEPSITALQAKYLLRAFLLQYRDPGQALEQLNAQLSVLERGEEFISLCVLVFDDEVQTLRYASAGHPAAFVWHQREVHPLGATGPLLMLDPHGSYHSRELSWDYDDVAVLYTDGLSEARTGGVLFGEDGVASMIRRDPTASADVLTKALVTAARDFAGGVITDDVAVLVLRRQG